MAAISDSRSVREKLRRRLLWKVPLIMLLVSSALWWEWRKQQIDQVGVDEIVGRWMGEVSYDGKNRYLEQFVFQRDGDKLRGTATYRGREQEIEEGKVDGEELYFSVRLAEGGESNMGRRRNRYEGSLAGKKLHVRLFDEQGSTAAEWILTRSATP